MHLKQDFEDEQQGFNETTVFISKSTWHPLKGLACLGVVKEMFETLFSDLKNSNMSKESLADDRIIVIKKQHKGSCIAVLERNDYLQEAEKQLSDTNFCRDVSNTENIFIKSLETCNKMFSTLNGEAF